MGVMPIEWSSACIVPLYKGKGARNECSNSRGISLLCVVSKLYGRVLIKRIVDCTDSAIGGEQCGFRSGRGCTDQIFAVRQVWEEYLAKGMDVWIWTRSTIGSTRRRCGGCCVCVEWAEIC